jgi:glycosyltransferase involved in cell wall biosynthesis
MIICHIAPFAPNRCGLYEAARDMARADIVGGNDVMFIDAGITSNGVREEGKVGQIDDRAGFKLETADPALINESDVIVMHTGVYDSWLVKCQSPILWVIHGRPLACFRPELQGKGESYSLYQNLAQWKRTKKMIYFWEEFTPHWDVFVSDEKKLVFDYPVIDENRFNAFGEIHTLQNKGKYNLLICDSAREDIDLYEMVIGCIEAVKQIPGLKIHFYGFDFPIPNCWNIVLGRLKELGGLGDVSGRVTNMELVYRAVDCVISPNRIITRTIAESLCCNTPVIAQLGCKVADYTCDMADTYDVVDAIKTFINDYDSGTSKIGVFERSKVFNMHHYSNKMNEIYKEVVNK